MTLTLIHDDGSEWSARFRCIDAAETEANEQMPHTVLAYLTFDDGAVCTFDLDGMVY